MATASVPIPPASGGKPDAARSPGLDAPPSLMSDVGGSTPAPGRGRRPTYTPDDLLSLAVQTPDDNAKAAATSAILPPVPAAKLASVQALLRDRLDSTAWGVSECSAKLLSDNNDNGDEHGRRSISSDVPFPAVSSVSRDSKASMDADGGSSALSGMSKYAGLMRFVGTTTTGLFDVVTDKTGLRGSSSSSSAVSSSAGSPIINLKEQTDAEVLFKFQSVGAAGHGPAPIHINFTDPFNNQENDVAASAEPGKAGEIPALRKASYAFQNMPIAGTMTPSSLPGVHAAGRDQTLSKFAGLRAGSLTHQGSVSFGRPVQVGGGGGGAASAAGPRSRSNSMESVSSDVQAISLGKRGSLNPFAPPFPLPKETDWSSASAPAAAAAAESATLRLPKVLPASLPRRPPGPIAPVFVRRESAALPQPMARPDVLPMGKEWEGDASLSGNERRRRASNIALNTSSLPSRPAEMSGGSSGDTRPERLQMLGRSLRASVAAKGVKAGSS